MHRGKSVLSRILQHGKDLLALHGWKPFEEILDRVTALEVVEETPHRNTRPGKNKFPAKNTRILRNDTGHQEYRNSVGLLMQLRRCRHADAKSAHFSPPVPCSRGPVVSYFAEARICSAPSSC